ncbi:MAG TPA: tautomerase family protein [Puia sp.]|nr:tautomerase family protein [Puia sp.]
MTNFITMPFVQINLAQNLTDEVKKNISGSIHESLVEVFKIPQKDFFQVIHEVRPSDLLWPDSYLNIPHTGSIVYIQIIARAGRTPEMKKALYKAIATKIADRTPVGIDDVFIVLVENTVENWSFGQGIAQYIQ